MNATLKLPKEELAALRPEDLQLYLTSRGWQMESATSSPTATVYHHPSEPDAEVLLPHNRDIADYALRMGDVAEMIAAVEGRSIREVLVDLAGPPADTIRLAIRAPEALLGTIPLNEGIRLVQGGREILLAAACSAHHPKSFYPRQSFTEAMEFIASCRLGQTERGSFTAIIVAPVPPLLEKQGSLFSDAFAPNIATEPYARRVTLRLMSGLKVLRDSIQTGAHEQILQGVEAGVSANLCEAIASVKPPGDQSSLQIQISWARSRANVPEGLPQTVSFSQGAFPIIEEVGRRLRERATPKLDSIEGFIVSLRGETARLDGFEGHVVIKAVIAGHSSRVHLTLNKPEYEQACNAHRDGRRVTVEGVLHRGAKAFEVLRPESFQVLLASR